MAMYVQTQRTSAASIPNNTRTKVTGLSLVEIDPTGAPSPWNNGTQQAIATTAGICRIQALAEWEGEQQGAHLLEAVVNGSTRVLLDQRDGDWSVTATTGLVCHGARNVRLDVDDTVELYVRQISGATQNLAAVHEFSVEWLRP